jgi:hypothetical protein
LGWDDKPSKSVFGDWPQCDSPDVDDATLEENGLAESEGGVWKIGSPLFDG